MSVGWILVAWVAVSFILGPIVGWWLARNAERYPRVR